MRELWLKLSVPILSGMLVLAVLGIYLWSSVKYYRAEALYEDSKVMVGEGDLFGAEAMLVKAIELDPSNPSYHSALGEVLAGEGDYSLARESFDMASKLDPDNPLFLSEAGRMAIKEGRPKEAIQYFERARESNPAHITAIYKLGDQYLEENDLDQAEEIYKDIIYLSPSEYKAYEKLGIVYTRKDNKEMADRMFNVSRDVRLKQASKLDPQNKVSLFDLGRNPGKKGRSGKARGYSLDAGEEKVAYVELLYKLGYQYLLERNLDKAERTYREIVALSPYEYEAYKSLGVVYTEKDRLDRAEQMFTIALEIMPDSPGLYNDLGNLMLIMNRNQEAKDWFKKALAINPDYQDAQTNLDYAVRRLSSEPSSSP